MTGNGEAVQTRRARQYALCTFALAYDKATDGAEGVFDQALTNGLAAIVAHTWPGKEKDRKTGRILQARLLLDVIKENTGGTGRIPHDPDAPIADDAEAGGPFGFLRTYTDVDLVTLHDALTVTQAIRHARDVEGDDAGMPLTEDHLKALTALDWHPALRSINDVHVDRDWERDGHSNDVEIDRARRYHDALDEEEIERRRDLDYEAMVLVTKDDIGTTVDDCPVCGAIAFVAREHDGLRGAVGIGHCWVCSYERTAYVAERELISDLLRRAAE
ncbi:hypothetical protein AB0I30_03120 [Nocardia tengchongensis]|uniref:hypothetical protein n=1 Tax=Nocardia tengchongensis TaxID=2055889 RepID=UPI0033C02184